VNHPDLIWRMYEVLDGAASPAESRELDRLLAGDPAARAQFEDLRHLFAALNTMPKALPPEGLVAAVMARMPPLTTRSDWLSQLSSRLGVIRLTSTGARGSAARISDRTQQVSRFESSMRSEKMSADKGGLLGNRIVWIGAGIAAVAVVIAMQYFNIPPKSASGTIVPAQRFQAAQPGAGDVNGAGQTGGATEPTPATSAGDVGADRASADRASADRASADRASADRASADRASADRASADRASADRASADRASADRSSADRASADRASADRAGADRASADRASADRASADRASADRASADRASADRASADRASADRASADRASADRASADRASADRANADRASADRSSNE
jgi:hypothetical protein